MIEPQTRIAQYLQSYGKKPSPSWLAVTCKITPEEAERIINNEQAQQKTNPAPKTNPPALGKPRSAVLAEAPAPGLGTDKKTIKDKIIAALDGPALAIAMVVDLALVGICLWVIAPGIVEKVGMALLSVVIVLFAVRAWIKGGRVGKLLWVCFALSAFFFDLSFALVSTDVQAVEVIDQELERLTGKVDEAETAEADLQRQYDAANNRATLDQLQQQIDAAKAKADRYRMERQKRLDRQEAGENKEITSSALSTAIYDAATSEKPGRVTLLIVFGLVFFGLQLTIIRAADGIK